MNRLFTALCMVGILGVYTSCNDNVMGFETPCIETKATVADQRVQSLIQQAREGDANAYTHWHCAIVMVTGLKRAGST